MSKIIYIDSDYKCHVVNNGMMTEVETEYFNGKCDQYIEGYRFIPAGESWTRADGLVFDGEMAMPWQDHVELDNAQRRYECALLAEYIEALKITGVSGNVI